MTLEDVDPPMFGAIVNWLYTQKIDEMLRDDDGYVVAIKEGRLVLLAKLWMLGQVRISKIPLPFFYIFSLSWLLN